MGTMCVCIYMYIHVHVCIPHTHSSSQDYHTIMDKMEFTKSSDYPYTIMDHE